MHACMCMCVSVLWCYCKMLWMKLGGTKSSYEYYYILPSNPQLLKTAASWSESNKTLLQQGPTLPSRPAVWRRPAWQTAFCPVCGAEPMTGPRGSPSPCSTRSAEDGSAAAASHTLKPGPLIGPFPDQVKKCCWSFLLACRTVLWENWSAENGKMNGVTKHGFLFFPPSSGHVIPLIGHRDLCHKMYKITVHAYIHFK